MSSAPAADHFMGDIGFSEIVYKRRHPEGRRVVSVRRSASLCRRRLEG